MVYNHNLLIATSGSNRESPKIVSVEFTDWLISNMELFCFKGSGISSLSYYFSSVDLAGAFLMPLYWCFFFLVDYTPCEDLTI